ncbi:MAG: integrase [Rhizobiales bacterium 65-9]|nr:integrase [Hyphomicrobiales bacterium]OJY38035.1 MAG: integrase [Rhizobiales bacterium 65-9]
MADGGFSRFMGGSPGGVVFRLVLASILVGAFMALFGLDPEALVRRVFSFVRGLFDLGWGAVDQVGRWLIYGAVIVVPVWFIARLLSGRR